MLITWPANGDFMTHCHEALGTNSAVFSINKIQATDTLRSFANDSREVSGLANSHGAIGIYPASNHLQLCRQC